MDSKAFANAVILMQVVDPAHTAGPYGDNCNFFRILLAQAIPVSAPACCRSVIRSILGAHVGVWGWELVSGDVSHVMFNDSCWHIKIRH